MESAGEAAAQLLREKAPGAHIVILCGKGNNGGDGFVAARHLAAWEAKVCVILVQGEPETELAGQMFRQMDLQKIQVLDWAKEPETVKAQVYSADFVLDAMYGIGFRGSLPDTLIPLLDAAETSGAFLLALDLPSGVSCDTGEVPGRCVRAAETVSFTALKPAHLIQPGRGFCGKVTVVPVGISESLMEEAETPLFGIEEKDLSLLFQEREQNSNKGSYGTLLSVCGSTGMAGAAMLAARASLRTGVGLVNMALPKELYPVVAGTLPEPVYTLLEPSQYGETLSEGSATLLNQKMLSASAVLLGCGLGTSAFARSLLRRVAACSSVPLVIDADGINLLAENIDILKTVRVPVVLTPHPGEMARLLHTTTEQVQARRLDYAKYFAREHGVTLVLKGSGTIVAAPDGRVFVNTTGNPGMAKGGSGDVLAGMIASLAAQGITPYWAAVFGVFLHGLTGDRCAKRLSQRGMLPSDLIEELPLLFSEFEQ
ncbi:NAD(P)H-hydrate dehydratase [Faecalispora anaeroviscerum]|uniref:NAD(P)H-hydrate dehydratase n=1 Tax=Faecalispora anaeroviscerum TaxID=2991836 RepID=UPI0024B98761|nr:NAD(P)H-hydrate dehydratase [Faecalispora anaeroviscerum]